jgi:nucleotide-binding universal stress UspA family protein
MEVRRVMVCLDGSPHAHRAASWAAGLAGVIGADVTAAHALGLLHRSEGGEIVTADAHRDEIRDELERWCAPLRDAGVSYRAKLLEGDPVTALLRLADEEGVDLIVVGSRGTGGAPGRLLGSTSTQLAQQARRPVVIVPEPV